jgi:alpha-mannosidase
VQAAREINAAEEPIGTFAPFGTELAVDFKPYQPRTFALSLQPRSSAVAPITASPIDLPFNLDGVSTDANRSDGDFDGKGQSIAGELLPGQLVLNGVPFKLGSSAPGEKNVLVPKGQSLPIPNGSFDRLYVLASAVGGDVTTTFTIAGKPHSRRVPITIREWQGPVGQWDSRLKEPRLLREVVVPSATARQSWTLEAIQQDMAVQFDRTNGAVIGIDRIKRGFVKREEIAWVGTHRHGPDGNQLYIASYLFAYALNLAPGTSEIRLPTDDRVRILAMTAARGPVQVSPAGALYSSDLPEPPQRPAARLARSGRSSSSRDPKSSSIQ